MRHVLLAPIPRFTPSLLLLTLSFLAAASMSAQAQDYPWCANYTKGSTSCSFVTYEQCMTDVSGIGGFCERNTSYHPATAPARPKSRASSKLN
ncbi:MAG TPA: DUF3551 domain-containing protein [Xanthobacteraceae bacterium]|jgi:hypothetical protein|nr:DUF3551 domain-containing protein [Xanthobacteraceae bacterium]